MESNDSVGAHMHQSVIQTRWSDKVPHPVQQHLCVMCIPAHRSTSDGQAPDHAELMEKVASSQSPPALIPSHSKLPSRVCFLAPWWGPGPWESRAQRAHNPIWQEMVGMPGYIHSRTHSPTWLAQRVLLKSGAVTSVHAHKQMNVQLTQIS